MEPPATPEAPAGATPPSPAAARNSTPRPVWHWLILLTPSAVMLTLCWLIEQTFDGESGIGPLMLNLLTIPLLSAGLGLWWTREKEDVRARIGEGLLTGLLIAVLNGLIAFAGCSMGIMR